MIHILSKMFDKSLTNYQKREREKKKKKKMHLLGNKKIIMSPRGNSIGCEPCLMK
jgi:hypothetical protein